MGDPIHAQRGKMENEGDDTMYVDRSRPRSQTFLIYAQIICQPGIVITVISEFVFITFLNINNEISFVQFVYVLKNAC